MKTGIRKIFLAISLFGFLVMPFAFAQAACKWEIITSTTSYGGTVITGGCKGTDGYYTAKKGGADCTGISAPDTISMPGQTAVAVCCCQQESGGAVETTAPKFEIPELQIDLPGLDLTKPNCIQGVNGEYKCEISWLGQYMTWIYDYGIKVAGILAAVMLMAGGILWLVSGGDAGKVGQAKEIITGSIVGLVILMSSYILLVQVNPELVKFRPISIGVLSNQQITDLVDSKNDGSAESYRSAGCATDEELQNGVDFYATGYCKPLYANNKKFFCAIAMNCSCPGNKVDSSQNCDEFYTTMASKGRHFSPCAFFDDKTDYCNVTKSGSAPYIGSIAGPKCGNLPLGTDVCFNNTNYKITDVGGAIEGKRIDIWTGDCSGASSVTGTGVLKIGKCDSGSATLFASTFNAAQWTSGGGLFDPGIAAQANDAGPELSQLLNCMRGKLPGGVGKISSISDSNYIGRLNTCNVAATCASASPKCAHSCGSCHYGGGSISAYKSYAVDFGDENNAAALSAAARSCLNNVYILNEGDHLHISTASCKKD